MYFLHLMPDTIFRSYQNFVNKVLWPLKYTMMNIKNYFPSEEAPSHKRTKNKKVENELFTIFRFFASMPTKRLSESIFQSLNFTNVFRQAFTNVLLDWPEHAFFIHLRKKMFSTGSVLLSPVDRVHNTLHVRKTMPRRKSEKSILFVTAAIKESTNKMK